mmetsp:Transcript_3890/g.12891  ORF Transcript_3890/g.12891 Transcript_3890/m.12891 type:complete len:223 (+) Transcript_3890:3043-3711(+)
MHAVSGFVRQSCNVSLGSSEVQQLERTTPIGGRTVRAASFSIRRRDIDSLAFDHVGEMFCHRRRKLLVSVFANLHRLFPAVRIRPGADIDSRVAIGPSKLLQPLGLFQNTLLQSIILLAQIHASRFHRRQQRVHGFIGNIIRDISLRTQILKPSLRVFDVPAPGHHVQTQRARSLKLYQSFVQNVHALPPRLRVFTRSHLRQQNLHVHLLRFSALVVFHGKT